MERSATEARPVPGTPDTGFPRAPWTALALTLAVQALATMGLTVPSVLAPIAAPDLGVKAQHVGWLVSVAYLAAMVTGLQGGAMSLRFGPVRMSQAALLSAAAGLSLLAAGTAGLLLVAALVIGVGYGLTNPSAAAILAQHVPPERRGLFFSIKQTGVPIGVAVTGLVVPALLAFAGWRSASLALALPIAAVALLVMRARSRLEPPAARRAQQPRGAGIGAALFDGWVGPLREVLAAPGTRRLALVSLVYAFTQVSFLTFLVSLLHLELGLPLAASAALLSGSQAVSVAARIGWGHVSDRWVDPTRLLGLLGIAMGASVALLGLLPAGTPWPVVLVVTVLCSGTAVAWNGVFFADLVRQIPAHTVARATGATQFMTFCGGMSGSGFFAALVGVAGGYGRVFLMLALVPAVAGALLLAARRGGARAPA